MKLFGRDLNEQVTTTYGRQVLFAGMLLQICGVLLTHSKFESLELVGLLVAAIGLFFLAIGLYSMTNGKGDVAKGENKTPNGN
ncbi:hypothetical protein QWY75_13220 [Pontixanthobacter aestiaquae]|uniref:Uncharacterized protein n=1 Tax=Pontixanthobacter aestiaquae TaxID=1509367 RepID=A0A844Z2F9_9SPHN|nr:hypothetical protein [Pontixanthobacter aestiaquae]MDN3647167.1 hypothetical protein [Pontixanthobacter aestiaquae]MXO81858.1 hypothetical protein [Pontixanthobacter aestiaquae]